MKDLVTVTCASGKQSTHLIPFLHAKFDLRLCVHSASSLDRLQKEWPVAEVLQIDLCQPKDCEKIIKDATTVFHMGPPLHPSEKEIGLNMVNAAVAEAARSGSKFQHFVFSSVLNTQLRRMANHDDKRYIEEALIESGLNFTVLQPADFLDMAFPVSIYANDEIPVKKSIMGLKSRSSFVVLQDLGEAAFKVIVEREKHYQALYPLVSLGPVTYEGAGKMVGEAMGKELKMEELPFEDAVEMLCFFIFGGIEKAPTIGRDKAERLILFYRRRGLQGNSNVLRWLLGRDPTSVADYVKIQMASRP